MFKNLMLLFLIQLISMLILPEGIRAQETGDEGVKTIVTSHASDTLQSDTTKIVEDAPLDIGQDRGLFIVTPDQKMQLRILGSVRYLVVFDNINLNTKNTLNTFEIPTPTTGQIIPNYYNGLDQSRLGFEITRKTSRGNVFIRFETDFAGINGFRIRHAYGQISRFLLGQTWSLFSHINALPSMVDFSGPTGSVVARTPQIRYSAPKLIGETNFAFGLEYFPPDLNIPDSLQIEAFQLIPDITIRADRSFNWGNAQVSGIIPVLSGRYENKAELIPGWGVSASIVINSWAKGKWYFQGVGGQAISRYFNDLGGNGFDIQFPASGGYTSPFTYGFYSTYEHRWTTLIYSNFTYSMVSLENKSFTPDNNFHKGHTVRMNTFWDITDGAKAGGEFIWGNRSNKDGVSGDALRFNLLFYYDF
jgi:hypothetical protein